MNEFVHLHLHTIHSPLDGMAKIKELILKAKSMGQASFAITDHGNMSGLYQAQKLADELDFKIINGCEFYYERLDEEKKNGHLLVLAKNNIGLRNLFRLQHEACTTNFYKKPRVNFEMLKKHSEGLVVTSTCLASEFNQRLLKGDTQGAIEWARKYQEVFHDDFYIEIQPNSMAEQHLVNKSAIRIAKQLNISIIATNDVHYANQEDAYAHEVLFAMQFKKKMSDPDRFKIGTDDFWLKSETEMRDSFQGMDEAIINEALSTTKEIADKCDSRIEKGKYLPKFYNIPDGETERSLLAKEIKVGSKVKGFNKNKSYMKDVQHELNVVDGEGYSGYFLIVQDYVAEAKKNGVVVGDGRGSGAGSKIAYLTDITEIEPSEFDLLFERFMAVGRIPDFDVDFSDQMSVFRDLQSKYGKDNVARIITFGKLTPRSVIRKVLTTFEFNMSEIIAITKLVPDLCPTLERAYILEPQLLKYKERYPNEWKVIERLEGGIAHEGTHAGGAIICPGLRDILPLKYDRKEDMLIACFDKKILEELGHYKFDVLGLETLPIIRRILDSIEYSTGEKIKLSEINYEDQEVYDMLCKGDVSGVFQLSAQATKVIEQQPRNFRDLIAINALIRPGVGDWDEYLARRQGKPWSVYEPRMPYMKETVGTMTYQEQYLLDAHVLAGWGIAYADQHIRKNKDIRNDAELATKFMYDAVEMNGHPYQEMTKVWLEIMDAVDGGYGFNKSHSASYGRTSYQTAYLKCKYPEHFYASLMSGEKTDGDGQNAIAGYIAECKQRNIKILPPHINNSGEYFVVNDNGINYRITTIKHVGDSAIKHINELRPMASFDEFMERREKKYIKKNVMMNLIKAGTFDFDNPNRAELLWKFDMSQRTKTQVKENHLCETYIWDDEVKCKWEKEVLGMYLSVHPMERYGFQPLDYYKEGHSCVQGGEVVTVHEFHPQKNTKKPKMAFIQVNTLYGMIKLVVFASIWARLSIQEAFTINNLVLIKGKRSNNDVLVDGVEVLKGESRGEEESTS